MPSAAGPIASAKQNLVFNYDTGDKGNSYIGEPTTNLLAAAGSDAALERSGTSYPYYAVDINSVVQSNWSPSNNTLTISYEGKRDYSVGGTGSGGDGYPVFYVYFTDWSWAATLDIYTYDWSYNKTTFTMPNPSGKTVYFSIYHMNAGNPGRSYSRNHQLEFKSHATPFVNGTRSATQSLLSLVSNSTIDLTNMSFDANAQITYDGTNDYASVTLPSSLNVYCLEMVWYNNNAIPNNDTPIGGPSTYQTPIEFNGNGTGVHLGSWTSGLTNEAIHIWAGGGATANQVYVGAGYHHVVFNWNGITYDIWVDGVNTTTYYASGTVPAALITATSIKLGNDVNGYCFNGQIPVTKIYDSSLTSNDIINNYKQYKPRFNLS